MVEEADGTNSRTLIRLEFSKQYFDKSHSSFF